MVPSHTEGAQRQRACDDSSLFHRDGDDHDHRRSRDSEQQAVAELAAGPGGVVRCRGQSPKPNSGKIRATRRPHRVRIMHQPRFIEGQSRTSNAADAAPISNAFARVSVPK